MPKTINEIVADLCRKWPRFSKTIEGWTDQYRKQLAGFEGDRLEVAYQRTLDEWSSNGFPKPNDIAKHAPLTAIQQVQRIRLPQEAEKPSPYAGTFMQKKMRDRTETEMHAAMARAALWLQHHNDAGRPPLPKLWPERDEYRDAAAAAEREGRLDEWARATWASVTEEVRDAVRRAYRNPGIMISDAATNLQHGTAENRTEAPS